jgi:predicted amidohydrolase
MDVVFADPEANTNFVIKTLEDLSAQEVDLVVFPECALTGYCVDSAEQALAITIASDYTDEHRFSAGHPLKRIEQVCNQLGMIAIVGFAEFEAREDSCNPYDGIRNTAAIFIPGSPPDFYRKTHLPELGFDKYVNPGDELRVFNTPIGKVGILICFDTRFPEASRILSLNGADLIAIPTNWPTGATISADLLAPARAVENKVFVLTCNRIGTENGFSFIGRSKIIDPMGSILQKSGDEPAILIAEVDFEIARNKRNVTIPGKHETTVFESRRTELYGEITNSPLPN